jgi:hypothetical protein
MGAAVTYNISLSTLAIVGWELLLHWWSDALLSWRAMAF